jgi:hypothetical protein
MPNSVLILTQIAWLHLVPAGYTSACAPSEPISQGGVLREHLTDSREHSGADRLLLAAQVVLKQFVAGNVAGIHAWD